MNDKEIACSISVRLRPTILLFGDSITEFGFGANGKIGWASLLSSAYSRRADVLSRGFSGYNTQHALSVLPSVLGISNNDATSSESKIPLLFCTIFFGANDASLPAARQHLPLEEYCENIRVIISTIRRHTITSSIIKPELSADKAGENRGIITIPEEMPIILITPPPVSPKAWDYFCTVTSPRPLSPRSNDQCKIYGSKLIEIGKEMNCPVLDTFQILGGDKGEDHYSKYLVDGIHLDGDGNMLIYNALMDLIQKDLKHVTPMMDGDGRYGDEGVPLEEKLWSELC